MSDQDMRLRLVVRRNGLPEVRLMWHVQLSSNPTISKLLEQLNDHVPLESENWGLEDYAVELHDTDGTDFECLHYQLVRSVLKPDDRVFVRALDRDDHRRRRISGRLQISSDGRHLIDGVPFGRPSLRAPAGRPAVQIPPRKRARFTYAQHDGDNFSQAASTGGDSPLLLLTDGDRESTPRDRIMGDFGDAESDVDSDSDSVSEYAEMGSSNSDSQSGAETDEELEEEQDRGDGEPEDLDQEARDLLVENAALESGGENSNDLATPDKLNALLAAFPSAPIDICERVLAASGGDLKTSYDVLSDGFDRHKTREAVLAWKPGRTMSRGNNSKQARALTNSAPLRGNPNEPSLKSRKLGGQPAFEGPNDDHSDEEEPRDASLKRKYDHTGFPPGTITSGKGLAHMAAISATYGNGKINGNSEATSTTLRGPTEELMEDDDETSSSGSSSDSSKTSSTSRDESDDADEFDASSDDSSSQSSSSGDDDSDQESSDELDQEPKNSAETDGHSSSDSTSGSDDSDSNSDSGPEEYPIKSKSRSGPTDMNKEPNETSESSDSTSDSESSDDTSDSESESQSSGDDSSSESEDDASDTPKSNKVLATKLVPITPSMSQALLSSAKPMQAHAAPTPVPPGAGKESTKRRNARRRAAKLAKREGQICRTNDANATMANDTSVGVGRTPDSEAALFEAKRKALLDAIATGGIEVGPHGETTIDHDSAEIDNAKRKRSDGESIHEQYNGGPAVETPGKMPQDDEEGLSASQKRRRIDLGAGRRLVFGALGLRNPKTKEDEDKLRNKLQNDAQLHINRRVSSRSQPTTDEAVCIEDGVEDLDAWKTKINYRAVECCHDAMELSPAPFPFRQRWDPQQQTLFFKGNKRGGQSKRSQRNQAHYYGDENRLSKKRKRNYSHEMAGNGYNETCEEEEEDDDVTNPIDIPLNYDDIQDQDGEKGGAPVNGTSQTTDLDDLPSLPQDVSALPILRPGEARAGMVITWQKWSCSSATNWQPLLSGVTAVIARVDDDMTALEVCLAKRDRYLDGNEKRYDPITGQRIYDKFEAPDLGDEEEDADDHDDGGIDEGYRNISWADMQDPRILQQPLDTTVEIDPDPTGILSVEVDETSIGIENRTGPDVLFPHSQQKPDAVADPVQTASEENCIDGLRKSNAASVEEPADSSVQPCTQDASNSTSHQAGQNQQGIGSAMSDISQISSPSRQLHETTSQALGSHSPIRVLARTPNTERTESPRPNTSSSLPLPATISSYPKPGVGSDDIVTGTPNAVLPLAVILSSTSSVRSGRQLDYAMEVDGDVLDPFDATDDIDHANHDYTDINPSPERSSSSVTPTPNPGHLASSSYHQDEAAKDGPIDSPLIAVIPASRLPSSPTSIFCTALTSHSTQSPSRAQMSSVNSEPRTRFTRDAKYEEAMRKLDEQFGISSDDESSRAGSDSPRVKRETSTRFLPRVLGSISPPPKRRPSLPNPSASQPSDQTSLSNPAYRRTVSNPSTLFTDRPRRRASRPPFTVPTGSQVVELSSDSEPVYTEDYADDDIDGTYSPELNTLPRGDGWVQKRNKKARRSVA
ncbi:hypothetical protein F4802DRAFT_588675 [Xylaria palmicola]|nr:hypothetical protein F4802DRAFT_588675 [Xylaria palmicola]